MLMTDVTLCTVAGNAGRLFSDFPILLSSFKKVSPFVLSSKFILFHSYQCRHVRPAQIGQPFSDLCKAILNQVSYPPGWRPHILIPLAILYGNSFRRRFNRTWRGPIRHSECCLFTACRAAGGARQAPLSFLDRRRTELVVSAYIRATSFWLAFLVCILLIYRCQWRGASTLFR